MDFSADITDFVRQRFGAEQYQKVIETLQCPALSTPRVMRSVLFLSNGSLTMLRHYCAEAEKDVRMILVEAEYITDVSQAPLFVRDMSVPFSDERNLGPKKCNQHETKRNTVDDHIAKGNQASYHKNIHGRIFFLGEVKYTVMEYQTSRTYVYCQRRTNENVSVARLPFIFVLEQLAEHIDVAPIEFRFVTAAD